MTDEEREQVVELLRCSADSHYSIAMTAQLVGFTRRVENCAQNALDDMPPMGWLGSHLEAAQRLEEGSWP